MRKTTFAIVGTGIVGERIIKQIVENEATEIVAVFDEDKARLAEISHTYKLSAVNTYDEVLALKPDWIYIGTPPVSHAELSERALSYGLNVLCEKPLAHDAKDGAIMAQTADEAPVHTAMHFPLMYSSSVRSMMNQVENGTIGDIIRVELNTYFPHWPRLWQQNPWIGSRKQGGFTREVFPHYFQLMYRMFGEIKITNHKTTYPENLLLAETGLLAIGQTEEQIPVLLNGLTGVGQEEELSYIVYGTEGVLKLRNWSELSISRKGEPFEKLEVFESVNTLIDECVSVINQEESVIVSFAEGLIVQKIIDHLLLEQ